MQYNFLRDLYSIVLLQKRNILTYEGSLYPVVVLQLLSRKVVSCSTSSRINREVATNALLMAVWRRAQEDGDGAFRSGRLVSAANRKEFSLVSASCDPNPFVDAHFNVALRLSFLDRFSLWIQSIIRSSA